jgi:hypothetical protein
MGAMKDGKSQVAVTMLSRTPNVLKGLVSDLESVTQTLDEGWSVKDVVAHLVDAESIAFADRIRRIVEEDRPFIESIDPPARLDDGGYSERSLTELLDDLAERRSANLSVVEGLSPQQLSRSGEHDQAGEISLEQIIHQWAYHDLMHLKQIASLLQEPLVAYMGNTRRFYDL